MAKRIGMLVGGKVAMTETAEPEEKPEEKPKGRSRARKKE